MGLELLGRMEKREKAPIALPFRETRPTFGIPTAILISGEPAQPVFYRPAADIRNPNGYSHGNGPCRRQLRQSPDGVRTPSWGGDFP
jgi:hypothetical protein